MGVVAWAATGSSFGRGGLMDPEMARQQAHEQAHSHKPKPPAAPAAPQVEPPLGTANSEAVAHAGLAGHAFMATALALCGALIVAAVLAVLALWTGLISVAALLRTENLAGAGLGLLLAFAVLWPLNYRRLKRAYITSLRIDPRTQVRAPDTH